MKNKPIEKKEFTGKEVGIAIIKCTEQEANALINLIHEAVKAKGLELADNAAIWKNKIVEAFNNTKITEQVVTN